MQALELRHSFLLSFGYKMLAPGTHPCRLRKSLRTVIHAVQRTASSSGGAGGAAAEAGATLPQFSNSWRIACCRRGCLNARVHCTQKSQVWESPAQQSTEGYGRLPSAGLQGVASAPMHREQRTMGRFTRHAL